MELPLIVSILLTLVSILAMAATLPIVVWLTDLREDGGLVWMTFVIFIAIVWLFGSACSIPFWWNAGGEAFGL
ncbi:hypothetical protein SEA_PAULODIABOLI_350 [Microbacterium phage PauloDiaboli]|nr:hypothetical protein SEA_PAULODIABOLI_350 [Microbacterium phage PauloDiaboli]QWY84157.1 hypothetical protein SEA_A3WALLY_350 [Microbacterium phage A3Wally]